MTDSPANAVASWDADTVETLREILADPALPVRAALEEPGGARLAALREAHDFISSRRLAIGATESTEATDGLAADLALVSPELAATLAWHRTLAPWLKGLPPSRARNAALGDIGRGYLVTWATSVRSWTWQDAPPTSTTPLARVDAEFGVDEYPGLYDAVLAWEPSAGAVVVIPAHREGLQWEANDDDSAAPWIVRLSRATFHTDELIRGVNPHLLPPAG